MRILRFIFAAGVALLASQLFRGESSGLALAADGSLSATPSGTPAVQAFTDAQAARLEGSREKFEFQAEVSRLMDIIINSLYTKVEIFLRELISNASDALDKIRFLALSDPNALAALSELEIRITGNKAARTLTIRDTGVGMTKQDLINYLGTVARSGTASLMEQLASGGDLNLIGQFGVGFYSVYLVADKVRVTTKHNDDKQYIWESAADGSYTIAEDPRGPTLGRGSEITLFLKEDALQYADSDELAKLIKRYSEFITFPIYLQSTKLEEVEVPIEAASDEAVAAAASSATPSADADEEVVAAEEDASPSAAPTPAFVKEKRELISWTLVNDHKAIWSRKPADVADSEYAGFYKAVSRDYADPLTWIHFKGEGEVEFRSILFTPGSAPGDLYENYYSKNSGLRLYVRKVLISDEFEELLPRYLNFIKGVVDSDDLPLNVSREQLQQAKILKVIAKKLVRKALEMIRRLAQTEKKAWEDKAAGDKGDDAKDADKSDAAANDDGEEGSTSSKKFEIPSHLAKDATKAYSKFWETFGKNIKLGVIEDSSNRSKLAKLLRFKSTASIAAAKEGTGSEWRSLEEYVAAMKPAQKQIYFIAGESVEALQASPFLERLTAAGLEVLFMTDPIDEYTVQNLPEYEGKRMQSITKEGLQLPEDTAASAKKLDDAYKKSFKPLTDYLKTLFGDKVEKVAVSSRLATTPCVLVTSQFGYSANMERIMRAQAFSDPSKAAFLQSRKTMEINPRHPIVATLKEKVEAAKEDSKADEQAIQDIAKLLFDTALLNSGFAMEDPKAFSDRMYRLLASGLDIAPADAAKMLPPMELPAEEEPAAGEAEEEGAEEEEGEPEAAEDDSAAEL